MVVDLQGVWRDLGVPDLAISAQVAIHLIRKKKHSQIDATNQYGCGRG
jgi:hypothetical protein